MMPLAVQACCPSVKGGKEIRPGLPANAKIANFAKNRKNRTTLKSKRIQVLDKSRDFCDFNDFCGNCEFCGKSQNT